MNLIKTITNENFDSENQIMINPKVRIGARGIVINDKGEIAIFHKKNKNEYKLPGGGVDENETIEDAFLREVLEETGLEVKIIKYMGITEEYRSDDNFKQISHVYIATVIKDTKVLHLTTKEKDEGGEFLFLNPIKALEKIDTCINKLKASKYENLYHVKFIVTRDKYILEEFINKYMITYVTGNWSKIMSAQKVLQPLGITVNHIKMDTTEVQADTVEEVTCKSAKEASDLLKCNVLKNDTGLFIESLNGFPGPYTHYVDEKLGEDGILKLLEGIENRNAEFIEAYAYCEYGKNPIVFKSITKGKIATKKSGKYGWSWDYIFIPENSNKTLGNYPDEERYLYWNNTAYTELAKYLINKLT